MNEENVRTLKVISLCSVCGEPVHASKHDKAARHGFKRWRKKRVIKFVQEDDKPCSGTGEEVVYKRFMNYKKALKRNKT